MGGQLVGSVNVKLCVLRQVPAPSTWLELRTQTQVIKLQL